MTRLPQCEWGSIPWIWLKPTAYIPTMAVRNMGFSKTDAAGFNGNGSRFLTSVLTSDWKILGHQISFAEFVAPAGPVNVSHRCTKRPMLKTMLLTMIP